MNVKQLAEYLSICEITVYRLLKQKKLPGHRVGGDWEFRKDEIDEMFIPKGGVREAVAPGVS